MSASFLVHSEGAAHLLAIGEQDVVVSGDRFQYRGGRLPIPFTGDVGPIRAAVQSVRGLRGVVGVDFISDALGERTTVLEINPRPTTSIVAIARLLPPGRLAAAWLRAADPTSSDGTEQSELTGPLRASPPISFDVRGNIGDEEGPP
jgi:predicted ATP-grasp superfamily ATP-dependent carboligase